MGVVYIFLADGFEEIEALATLDMLRRGGVTVKTVSITERQAVLGAHGVKVEADWTYGDFKSIAGFDGWNPEDVLVFPGGMPGAKNLSEKQDLVRTANIHFAMGGTVAAICAAPGLVVSRLDGIEGRRFTCFDGFEGFLTARGAEYERKMVVSDGHLITGRGPGCAVEFGLAILESIKGKDEAERVRSGLMIC